MNSLPTSLSLAFGQLGDPAIIRVFLKSIGITLILIALVGVLLFQAIINASAYVGMSIGAEATYFVAIVLTMLASWLLFRIIALIVLQFFADEVVAAVEKMHYLEHAANVRKVPFRQELAHAARGGLRALGINLLALPFALILLVTGIGTAVLFWAVNAWLLGRELQDMVWLRHRHDPAEAAPLTGPQRFMLGGAVAGIMFVPFLNLLAPILGAASATHMVHRSKEQSL
ncbi:EI24 domain-containing protein [Altererythrobacter sp. MF3-039]|uniref:EI24 domain-containing protein n=1 Tax=Altererythrobacter sp. MF3-039 TaxID=3252901 RepID=UPI00390C67BC